MSTKHSEDRALLPNEAEISTEPNAEGAGEQHLLRGRLSPKLPSTQFVIHSSHSMTNCAQTSSGVPGRRILVVDDNVDSAESLTTLLKLTGNETRAAFDGLEALESRATFQPEVILLDIGLAELNGYEVARKVREQPWGKNIILIALTGWGQKEDRRRSQEAGFDHHLNKTG